MFDEIKTGKWWDKGLKLVEGCTKVSPACDNCWALSMDERFTGSTKVKWFENRLQTPIKRKKPTVYAIWNDLFHEDVPFEYIDKAFAMMALCSQHIFIVLTKRPERMASYCNLYREQEIRAAWSDMGLYEITKPSVMRYQQTWPNVWLGVTAENQEMADKRIPPLLKTPAAKRVVSIEPMLSEINLTKIKWAKIDTDNWNLPKGVPVPDECWSLNDALYSRPADELNPPKVGLDWVICGGETGAKARPMHPDWLKSLCDQCEAADVPFFFKAWGEWSPCSNLDYNADDLSKTFVYGEFMDGVGIVNDTVFRTGKKRAGRLLNCREHNDLPEVKL